MISGKKQAFRIFLIYFFIYAISPLTYTVVPGADVGESKSAPKGTASVRENARLLLWEFIIGEMAAKEDASRHQEKEVIIRKKRAIMPEDEAAKLFPVEKTFTPKSGWIFSIRSTLKRNNSSIVPQGTREGFHPLYAGHSPPVLS